MVFIVNDRFSKDIFAWTRLRNAVEWQYRQSVLERITSIWAYVCKCFKVESVFQILNFPLWFNSNLTNGDYFYIKDWYNKGLKHVSDLTDEHGNFYEFDVVKTRYNLGVLFWISNLALEKFQMNGKLY